MGITVKNSEDFSEWYNQVVQKAGLADYSTDEERNLRAVVIEWLCYDKKAAELVTHRGISLKEANIEGLVNLAYLNIQFPLCFEKCNIPEQIELHSARLQELYMGGSHIGSLSGYGMKIEGHVFLRNQSGDTQGRQF